MYVVHRGMFLSCVPLGLVLDPTVKHVAKIPALQYVLQSWISWYGHMSDGMIRAVQLHEYSSSSSAGSLRTAAAASGIFSVILAHLKRLPNTAIQQYIAG